MGMLVKSYRFCLVVAYSGLLSLIYTHVAEQGQVRTFEPMMWGSPDRGPLKTPGSVRRALASWAHLENLRAGRRGAAPALCSSALGASRAAQAAGDVKPGRASHSGEPFGAVFSGAVFLHVSRVFVVFGTSGELERGSRYFLVPLSICMCTFIGCSFTSKYLLGICENA